MRSGCQCKCLHECASKEIITSSISNVQKSPASSSFGRVFLCTFCFFLPIMFVFCVFCKIQSSFHYKSSNHLGFRFAMLMLLLGTMYDTSCCRAYIQLMNLINIIIKVGSSRLAKCCDNIKNIVANNQVYNKYGLFIRLYFGFANAFTNQWHRYNYLRPYNLPPLNSLVFVT